MTKNIGSFGKVFKVKHTLTKTDYAIKIIQKAHIIKHHMKKQIVNEIKILEMCNHKNIIQLITYFEDPANIYLVMELGGV